MRVAPALVGLVAAAAAQVLGSCVSCPQYVALSGPEKLSVIWNKTVANAYTAMPNTWPSVTDLFGESMNTTFDRFADEFPSARSRLVHAHGALAKVTYTPNQAGVAALKLTGVYASGSQSAVIRLSLAGQPGSFSPGFAVKFFIDGRTSANIVGMFSLDGQGTTDFNFFRNQLKTTVPLPSDLAVSFISQKGLQLFETGSTPATNLMPDQASLHSSDGTLTVPPYWPDTLYMVPNPALTASWNNFTGDFRTGLGNIAPGTLLYSVFAADGGCSCAGVPCADALASCSPVLIGTVTTSSLFVSSPYVDNGIFFQHSRWFKRSRFTCVYASALDSASIDSTVLSTDNTSMCATAACAATGLVSSASGCMQEDAYLVGAPVPAGSSAGLIAGVVLGVLAALAAVFLLVRRRRRMAKESGPDPSQGTNAQVLVTDMPFPASAAPGWQAAPAAKPMPPRDLGLRLKKFYAVHERSKTQTDVDTVVAHFRYPGGEDALNKKLVAKYGTGLSSVMELNV